MVSFFTSCLFSSLGYYCSCGRGIVDHNLPNSYGIRAKLSQFSVIKRKSRIAKKRFLERFAQNKWNILEKTAAEGIALQHTLSGTDDPVRIHSIRFYMHRFNCSLLIHFSRRAQG